AVPRCPARWAGCGKSSGGRASRPGGCRSRPAPVRGSCGAPTECRLRRTPDNGLLRRGRWRTARKPLFRSWRRCRPPPDRRASRRATPVARRSGLGPWCEWCIPRRTPMKLKVLYHDRCFDGLSSAAIFSRFYLEKVNPQAELVFQGLTHKLGEVFTKDSFDGDENVVVDFRYSSDPRLTWWFDHHVSGFPTPEDRAHFEAQKSGKQFYDPKAKSCAKFIARTLGEKFGFQTEPLRELI